MGMKAMIALPPLPLLAGRGSSTAVAAAAVVAVVAVVAAVAAVEGSCQPPFCWLLFKRTIIPRHKTGSSQTQARAHAHTHTSQRREHVVYKRTRERATTTAETQGV